jgi:hypothetical protein
MIARKQFGRYLEGFQVSGHFIKMNRITSISNEGNDETSA